MGKEHLKMTEISRSARDTLLENPELVRLYRRALRQYAEGELLNEIMKMAMDALEDEDLKEEAFSSSEIMFSFFCGIWIHFLLIEVAGIKKERLRIMVKKIFMEGREDKPLH